MSESGTEIQWSVAVCPNPRCHRVLAREVHIVIAAGCIEFQCKDTDCKQRAVLGEDPERPPRPQAILVDGIEAYRAYRDAARNRESVKSEPRQERRR